MENLKFFSGRSLRTRVKDATTKRRSIWNNSKKVSTWDTELISNINFLQENDEKSSNFDSFEILFRQITQDLREECDYQGTLDLEGDEIAIAN